MPPAARLGDMHVCPMVTPGTPPVPHAGGPILVGCPTVLIAAMPAARVGDTATCVGPPDAIAMGSASVMIGGMPAARLGDKMVHGGTITVGCPTVMIGDAGGGPGAPAKMPASGSPGGAPASGGSGSGPPATTGNPSSRLDAWDCQGGQSVEWYDKLWEHHRRGLRPHDRQEPEMRSLRTGETEAGAISTSVSTPTSNSITASTTHLRLYKMAGRVRPP